MYATGYMQMEVVENNFTETMDAILLPKDSATIKSEIDRLRDELKTVMLAGDAVRTREISLELRDLPLVLASQQLSEAKQELKHIADELAQCKTDEANLIEAKKQKLQILEPIIEQYLEAQSEVSKIELAFGVLDAQRQGLHSRRREIQDLIKEKMTEIQNDKFNT